MAAKKKINPFAVPIYSLSGRVTEQTIDLSPEVFGIKPNKQLVAQAVRVYLSRCRNAHAKVKSRGEVRGSRRKIWSQKGTGRARHGDRYAPIFVGGGVAHGPRGDANWQLRLPKKMKRLALLSVLSDYFRERKLLVVSGWQKLPPKTRKVEAKMATLLTKQKVTANKVAVFLYGLKPEKQRGLKNLRQIEKRWQLGFINASRLNAYRFLQYRYLLINPEAIDYLNKLGAGEQ